MAKRDKAEAEALVCRMAQSEHPAAVLPDWIDAAQWGLVIGALEVGLARSAADLQSVQMLRNIRFRGAGEIADWDVFDPLCLHLLIRRRSDQQALASARLRRVQGGAEVTSCYCARVYDLTALAQSNRCCLEIGRICIDAAHVHDPDVLRALLAGLTRLAQQAQADILMGCASFRGADPVRHGAALAYLATHHLGPAALRPGRGAGQVFDLPSGAGVTQMTGLRHVPALLRLYLGLGGWVSDHAVLDPDLDTLHVFAAVEVAAIPQARLQALQHLAQG